MNCSECKKELLDNAKFCRFCGAEQSIESNNNISNVSKPSENACKKCGGSLSNNAKFCKHCGTNADVLDVATLPIAETPKVAAVSTTAGSNKIESEVVSNKVNSPSLSGVEVSSRKVGISGTQIAIGLVAIALLGIFAFVTKSNNSSTPAVITSAQQAVLKQAEDDAAQKKLIETADTSAVLACTFNINRIIYNLVFNNGRVPPSIDIIGFYLQAKTQLHGLKLVQSEQTQSTVIAFNGTGIDGESLKRLPLCVEKVPLTFTDGTKEDYLVAYLYDSQNSNYLSIQPIAPDESAKLIEWYNKVAAKNVRAFGSLPNTSADYVAEVTKPQTQEQNDAIAVDPAKLAEDEAEQKKMADDEAKRIAEEEKAAAVADAEEQKRLAHEEKMALLQQQKEDKAKRADELKKAREELALAKLQASTEQEKLNAEHARLEREAKANTQSSSVQQSPTASATAPLPQVAQGKFKAKFKGFLGMKVATRYYPTEEMKNQALQLWKDEGKILEPNGSVTTLTKDNQAAEALGQ